MVCCVVPTLTCFVRAPWMENLVASNCPPFRLLLVRHYFQLLMSETEIVFFSPIPVSYVEYVALLSLEHIGYPYVDILPTYGVVDYGVEGH